MGKKQLMVFGFTGPAGVGKTTLAEAFVNHFNFTRISFAGPLRQMLRALGLDEWELANKERPIERLGGITPRRMLQTLGTEWGRDMVCKDLWVRIARKNAKDQLKAGYNVIFDDVRFVEEAELVRELGGCNVKLMLEKPESPLASDAAEHISETGLIDTLEFIHRHDIPPEQCVREYIDLYERLVEGDRGMKEKTARILAGEDPDKEHDAEPAAGEVDTAAEAALS